MPNKPVQAAAEGVSHSSGDLVEMPAREIKAVNVVLHCLLCPRFPECEAARQLVAEPLSLVDHIAEGEK
ncbi:hypothetical protein [Rhizobium rhizogenes]|uniref:hypothetical protein n=1 Tax=Rhizobium rhizogenes TaxID=359 RepID=UPI001572B445|nr:hypothetical protein [Rhizobium rhizogenes]NTI29261.1 hypothetical protein [Rhizobium rhizogenes]